jgi:hypothetical protein
MLEEYASQHAFPLDPAYARKIVELIHAAGATTTGSWHGPYDPLPSPAAGNSQILKIRSADYSKLQEGWAALKDSAVQVSIPENYRTLLQEYYSMKLAQISTDLANLQRPREEMFKEMEENNQRMIEEMRLRGEFQQNPNSR